MMRLNKVILSYWFWMIIQEHLNESFGVLLLRGSNLSLGGTLLFFYILGGGCAHGQFQYFHDPPPPCVIWSLDYYVI